MSEDAGVTERSPYRLLRAWEERARRRVCPLPGSEGERAERWTGIGFVVAGERVMVPMSQVREIGHYPRLRRVPGTRSWLRGIANLGGRLAAVVDLAGFLTGTSTEVGSRSRVLEVRDDNVPVALLVAEMAGLRHFRSGMVERDGAVPGWLVPFATGRVADDRGRWTVMDLSLLVHHPDFMRVQP